MKKQLPAWLALCIIALVAGLLLGATNEMTAGPIKLQTEAAANAARIAVLPEAGTFEALAPDENASVEQCFVGMRGADIVGYTAQMRVKGYGGEIEVTTGVSMDGVITGIHVGGANFAETAGLGAKTKDAAFTAQFAGKTAPLDTKKNGGEIDAVTAATISSTAVISAVNKSHTYIAETYLGAAAEEDLGPLPNATNLVEQPPAEQIDAWWKADEGVIVQVTQTGYDGPIQVSVGIYNDGTIAGVSISEEGFIETAGLGERVLEASFRNQFIGHAGEVAYGNGIDAITGASLSSGAVLRAVNIALSFAGSVQ